MEGTLVIVYFRPNDVEVVDEFLKVVHGFSDMLLVLCDPKGGAKENMASINTLAVNTGMSFLELPNFKQVLDLFSPNRVVKIELSKQGKFDPTEIAAELNDGKTDVVVFGDSLKEIKGDAMYIEESMGPVGACAVVLHGIDKFVIRKET